ncbi:MAG: XRE family transcriptional regulator, partial [Brevundimonas sp.]
MARTAAPDHIDAYVGARIGLRRSALGLSQAALAQRIGVSFQQVQKYETGQNRISASRLHRAAVVLGASVDA